MNEKIIKTFYSKRNTVQLVDCGGKLMVKKTFCDNADSKREYEELSAIKTLNVPKIISFGESYIYMTYIEGELFLEKFLSSSDSNMPSLAKLLADFLKSYNTTRTNRIIADLNFRNFIIVGNSTLYGVDFESTKEGHLEESAAKAIAFAILYDIDQKNKKAFITALINEFDFSIDMIKTLVNTELEMLCARRKIPLTDFHNLI